MEFLPLYSGVSCNEVRTHSTGGLEKDAYNLKLLTRLGRKMAVHIQLTQLNKTLSQNKQKVLGVAWDRALIEQGPGFKASIASEKRLSAHGPVLQQVHWPNSGLAIQKKKSSSKTL